MKEQTKKSVKSTLSVVRALKNSLQTNEKRSFPRYLCVLSNTLRKITHLGIYVTAHPIYRLIKN